MLLRTGLSGRTTAIKRTVATHATATPPLLRVPQWESLPGLIHGFCGRQGGSSQGSFASLNLSFAVGDQPSQVEENWRRVPVPDGPVRFITMRQQHGAEVATVDARMSVSPEADAMISDAGGIALCVLTADCVPILLLAQEPRVVAAVHAGWRGTVLGIVRRAVAALHHNFGVEPHEIRAALGPAIGRCCYEVAREITDDLQRRWGAMPEAVVTHGAKSQLDLRRVNGLLLAQAGVAPAAIEHVGPCTQCAADAYFSYRAARRADVEATGRQVSFIGWQV